MTMSDTVEWRLSVSSWFVLVFCSHFQSHVSSTAHQRYAAGAGPRGGSPPEEKDLDQEADQDGHSPSYCGIGHQGKFREGAAAQVAALEKNERTEKKHEKSANHSRGDCLVRVAETESRE